MDVAPGTVVVWSDIACPWAHLAVHRLHGWRARLGLDDRVHLDHRAFPLELVNRRGTPKPVLDAEVPVVGARDPQAGWVTWQGASWEYPVSTLLALEAVQAAKEQGWTASEQLDLALRRALFARSRCVSLYHVVLDVAESCDAVDVDALAAALESGRYRSAVLQQWREARDAVAGSPHLFLPDGSDVHNPGIEKHWVEGPGRGFPVIDGDVPEVYRSLLERALAPAGV